jgi:hypothetical protein
MMMDAGDEMRGHGCVLVQNSWNAEKVKENCKEILAACNNGVEGVYGVVHVALASDSRSPAEDGLVRQRTVKRYWPSDSSCSIDRCLSRAEYANVYRRYVVATQSDTSHVKPLVAALTLDHWLTFVSTVADTPCAFA